MKRFFLSLASAAGWRLEMRLSEALRLGPGKLVTFTGAGGKTSALRRLAADRAADEKVLLTVTTRLAYAERDLAAHHLIVSSREQLVQLPALLEEHGSLLLTGPADEARGKLAGVEPAWVDAARELVREAGAWVAVEGDGAKGRRLKAPAEHEPVVPAGSDLLAPTFNLGAIGRPLDEEVAHRPERAATLLGIERGQLIEPRRAVELLSDPSGGLKGRPEGTEVRILLTGETEGENLRAVVVGLLDAPQIRAVVHAPDATGERSLTCYGRIGAVVLAAGGASRMGELKQVMPWRGRPLVAHAVESARAANVGPVVVVTGAQAARVRSALGDETVRFVHNPDWERGQSTSMQRGLAAMRDEVEAVVFLLADMPLIEATLIERLVDAHRGELPPIVAPRAGGRWGNPVLFDRVTFSELMNVRGDQGGRALYDSYPVLGIPAGQGALLDLDAPGDLDRLERPGDEDPVR